MAASSVADAFEIGCDCDGCNVWTLIKVKQVSLDKYQEILIVNLYSNNLIIVNFVALYLMITNQQHRIKSLSGNIGCSSFDRCNYKVIDSEGELDRCGPWRGLFNSISSDRAHVDSEYNKCTRYKDYDGSCCVLSANLSESASSVSQTRLDNDVDAVKTIISTMFDYSDRNVVSKLTVRSMFQLGKKTSDNHPRLLKVVLGSTIKAKSLLIEDSD
ncbi:hypothetical protein GJ496_007107 [Pomphorhynchus laevis]|nr:hypothetical protein GJ496_007107 [Pomphorhynchus laevis]